MAPVLFFLPQCTHPFAGGEGRLVTIVDSILGQAFSPVETI